MKLLPCPFCGSEARYHTIDGRQWVSCQKCYAMTGSTVNETGKASAVYNWNMRVKCEKES